jgi:hypothetical protein
LRDLSIARAANDGKERRELLYLKSGERVKWRPLNTSQGYLVRRECLHLGSWTIYSKLHLKGMTQW